MRKQSLITSKLEITISDLLSVRTRHDITLFIILFVALVSLTPVLTLWGLSAGMAIVLATLGGLVLATVLIRWPILGLYLIALCAFVVEQEPLNPPVGTDSLYVFYWPTQMAGFIERPIGILMLLSLFIWIMHQLIKRRPLLQGGALIGPFSLYMACVVGAIVYGLATGGNISIIVLQFRPFWYTFLSYILAYNFVTRKSHVRSFFWLAIFSAGFKGLQGLYVYLIVFHGHLTGHDTIMSHEESFFYAALLLLLIIFCLHYRYRPQLIACICVAPAVIIALVANQRRTDYIALLLGIGFAWTIVFLIKPKARRALLRGMVICVLLSTAYIALFSQNQGTLGSPARSIIGVFNPSAGDSRDASSNLYRDAENADLIATARQYPLGLGFGKTFLQPQSLVLLYSNILQDDPYYNYIPHNTIYWIWVDLGPIGFFALWFLMGSIIIRGCFIARQLKDPYLQVIAIYIVAITAMEVAVAFADYQLFFYRNVIDMGLLSGLLVKLPLLDKEQKENLGMDRIDKALPPQQKEIFTHESINDISVFS
jgi:O-Antigen ligase